jgi:hypothetical protein
MSTRWLTGALLFALGGASAMLFRPEVTRAASTPGVVLDGNLSYVDGSDFRLVYPNGATEYLVVLKRKSGKVSSQMVSTQTGQAVFSKKDLDWLTVYRLEPRLVVKSESNITRCLRGDDQCPLPPPPPPLAVAVTFIRPGTQTQELPTQ